jgi:glycosyltransferase involved in cell wall biosynthesis
MGVAYEGSSIFRPGGNFSAGSTPIHYRPTMLSVVLVAPTIDGRDVGEALVAHNWAVLLSERVNLTILTYRKQGAASITEQVPKARVIEWNEPPLVGRWSRFNSLFTPAYFLFYARARRWLKRAKARGERFDMGHQVAPVAMRYPSPFPGTGIPYVIGPVGGSLESPAGFTTEETGPWYLRLRQLDRWRLHHDPWLRRTYEQAACVMGIADYVRDILTGIHLRRLEIMSDVGLMEAPASPPRSPNLDQSPDRPLRLLFAGRVIRTKGVRDLVAAMGMLRDLPVVADVVGDGFDMAECQRLATEIGAANVVFHGWKSRPEVDPFYEAADVFVFPSYREPGGTVVFEAMGYALPLIVCDRGGPSAAVDQSCAILVSATTPAQYAQDLASAIRQLVEDPSRRLAMGEASLRRLNGVGLWPRKVDRMCALYQELLA